jgi:hypothetical protein
MERDKERLLTLPFVSPCIPVACFVPQITTEKFMLFFVNFPFGTAVLFVK